MSRTGLVPQRTGCSRTADGDQIIDLWSGCRRQREDTGFRRCGLLYRSNDDAIVALVELVAICKDRWRDEQDLSLPHPLRKAMPRAAPEGACLDPTDGTAIQQAAPPSGRADELGAASTSNAPPAHRASGGRFQRCRDRGRNHPDQTVVSAFGAWASSFCRQLGIRFPQPSVPSIDPYVSPVKHPLPAALSTAWRPLRNDGR